ncbi:MAG: tetratricopeptide repeat protein [Alphaproteobacteria bacterium]|nr:tetratricopeptide repeat protein [Alphaproteobacteria bacterium]
MDIAWTKGHLGIAYIGLNDPEKARSLLEDAIQVYRKNLGENKIGFAWVSLHLGHAYTRLGLYDQARPLLQKAAEAHNKLYGENHHFSKEAQEYLRENEVAEKSSQ